VPWCEECDQLVEDEDLTEDGECPTCGTELVEEYRPIPWYWKLLIVVTIIYLGWRTYQGVTWLIHHV
jgi:uncharacterized paraquat-inducible protein A